MSVISYTGGMSRVPEVAAAYARLVLQSGQMSPADLLEGTGLTEHALADTEFVPAAQLTLLFRNFAEHVNDSTWTTQLGTRLNVAAHGPLGFAALSAPTLGAAMDVMGELAACRNTATQMSMCETDTHYSLHLHPATDDLQFYRWISEVVLKIIEIMLATIIGHPVGRNVVISFPHPAPADATALCATYDSAVRFGTGETSIAVPLAWRQLPSPLYDESVYRANLIECREMIVAREQANSLAHAIANRLRNHFDAQCSPGAIPAAPPTQEEVAEQLHMTPRTLIRRLKREDTSFRALLESLRREYAERLLGDARLTVADVGQVLGYQEAANFGRAFRRWYGRSPAAWRRSG